MRRDILWTFWVPCIKIHKLAGLEHYGARTQGDLEEIKATTKRITKLKEIERKESYSKAIRARCRGGLGPSKLVISQLKKSAYNKQQNQSSRTTIHPTCPKLERQGVKLIFL